MSVTSTQSGINGTGTSTSTVTTKATALGRDDFLKMLVAQLKNQDPLNPASGTDFAAQLAQFSSLEQLSNLNDGIKNLGLYQMNSGSLQAVSLIGKEVSTSGGNTFTVSGGTVNLQYRLASNAENVTVSVLDSSGAAVETIQMGAQSAGLNQVSWTGPDGTYSYRVTTLESDGSVSSGETLLTGKVAAVSFRDGSIYLTVEGQEVSFNDVLSVR
jgi:flagellar basal-body rod modification protein FlgD